jgi:hypothetical protein
MRCLIIFSKEFSPLRNADCNPFLIQNSVEDLGPDRSFHYRLIVDVNLVLGLLLL